MVGLIINILVSGTISTHGETCHKGEDKISIFMAESKEINIDQLLLVVCIVCAICICAAIPPS